MSKMLQFDEKALKSILKGIKILSKAVKVTLGPKGRNVVIKKDFGLPLSTKDGVTVAKEISLKDKFENMGVELIKEAASKTADVAGDGTTTAIVLAESIYSEGVKNVIAGNNPMLVKKGIEIAVKAVIEKLDELATDVKTEEEIKQIATISANNDEEIGEIISVAMKKVGKDGIVSIGEAKGIETVLDVVEGMEFDQGFISPYFITNPEKMNVELENASIFITDKKLSSAKDIVPILEKVMDKETKPLLIIAEDIDSEALATLVVNKLKASMPVCAVKAPGFGGYKKSILEDVAILTNATVVSDEVGLQLNEVGVEVLGHAKKIKISKEKTTIIDGLGDREKLKQRIAQIKVEIQQSTSDYEKEKLEERLARLVGGVAVINIGAITEAEMKEKKARVEDALHATRAATFEGIVPGGGVAFLRCIETLETIQLDDERQIGVEIIKKALRMPIISIANNCGKQGDLIAEKVLEKKGSWGYNGLSDKYADLIKDGIIDPVLVSKNALINASSVASLLITVAAMITDKPKPKDKSPADPTGGMGPMGGMGGPMGGMGGLGGMGGMGGMGPMGMM